MAAEVGLIATTSATTAAADAEPSAAASEGLCALAAPAATASDLLAVRHIDTGLSTPACEGAIGIWPTGATRTPYFHNQKVSE